MPSRDEVIAALEADLERRRQVLAELRQSAPGSAGISRSTARQSRAVHEAQRRVDEARAMEGGGDE